MPRPLSTLLAAGLLGAGVAWAADPGAGAARPAEIDGVPTELAQEIFQIEILRLPAKSLATHATDADADVRRRVALALGRLRDPAGALPLLTTLAADPDVGVRREAAFALGQTEGAGEALLGRWAAEADPEVRATLAVALGKQGGITAVPLLGRALDATDGDLVARDRQRAAAAEALGRLGMRKIEGATTEAVARALVDHIGPPVGETRRRAAWALARLGLGSASPALRARLFELASADPDADVRAWLTRAWSGVTEGEERARGLATLVRDRDAGVRTAAARALAKGCVPDGPVLLGGLLGDGDHGVRLEAVNALATCPGSAPYALLRPVLEGGDPVLAAAAVGALSTAKALPMGLPPYLEASRPLLVRVAAVRALDDRPQLLQLALQAPEPSMRSAAVERLLEAPSPAELKALLAAPDPVIATAAADTLRTSPTLAAEGALLARLGKGDLDEAMAATFVRALSTLYATGRVRTPDPGAVPALTRWLFLPTLAQEARQLDLVLDLPPLPTPHTPRRVPELAEVRSIRSARVLTSEGELRIALRPDVAPYTVWNFATLAEKGFYDGVPFHRVVPDFVVQAGDPRGDGWGGPGWEIPDELNDLSYDRGAVGMALSGPDTGGSQWFVTLSDQPHLEGTYTVFGHLVYGQRNAEAIHQGATIRSVTIERVPPRPGS